MPHVRRPQHRSGGHARPQAQAQHSPAPGSNGTQPRRKLVLIVEDHASIGGLISALIRQEGYRSVRAWSVEEAQRLARGRSPDLILLDLNLPYPDGIPALDVLRSQDPTRRTPVLVVAAHPPTLPSEAEEGVLELVKKPFDIDLLLNAVRGALGDPLVDVQPRHFDAQDYFLNGY